MKMIAIKFYRKAVRSWESEEGRTREAGKRARVCLCNLRERESEGAGTKAAGRAQTSAICVRVWVEGKSNR